MVALRFADRSVGLLSTVILARLLLPADFGLVALANAMVASIAIFGEFGFELALIQNQKAERSYYDTAWTLGLLRGVTAAVVIALIAEPLAIFFEDPRLGSLILVLAFVPFLEGLYNIGTVAFRKDLRLHKEFIFRIVPRTAGVITTIIFAFAWRNYWALVIGILAGTAMRVVMSYLMHSYRPRMSITAWRNIMHFSKWMLVTSVTTFIKGKAGTFIIAKFLDTTSLGIYSMASQIASLASAELIAPVKQALYPGYTKLAHDVAMLKKAFLDAYAILVVLALPIALGTGLTADLFVPILLGPNWDAAIPLIEVLAISGGLASLSSHVQPVYLALNRPHLGAYAMMGRIVIYLPALAFGLIYYGVMGAAIVSALGQVFVLIGSMYLMHRMLRVSLLDLVGACWRAISACALMAIAVASVKSLLPPDPQQLSDQLISLTAAVLAGMTTYVGAVLALWFVTGRPSKSAETYLLAWLGRRIKSHPPAPGEASSNASP